MGAEERHTRRRVCQTLPLIYYIIGSPSLGHWGNKKKKPPKARHSDEMYRPSSSSSSSSGSTRRTLENNKRPYAMMLFDSRKLLIIWLVQTCTIIWWTNGRRGGGGRKEVSDRVTETYHPFAAWTNTYLPTYLTPSSPSSCVHITVNWAWPKTFRMSDHGNAEVGQQISHH